MASALPPHRIESTKDSVASDPISAPSTDGLGNDSPCLLGILTGCLILQLLLKVVLLLGW